MKFLHAEKSEWSLRIPEKEASRSDAALTPGAPGGDSADLAFLKSGFKIAR
jgi:hypothetical protein